jgi:hypothetical protein
LTAPLGALRPTPPVRSMEAAPAPGGRAGSLRGLLGLELGGGDLRPVHAQAPGETAAQGQHVLSAAVPMIAEVLQRHAPRGAPDGVLHGLNRVRFPSAVPLGDLLRCQARVTQVVVVPGALQVSLIATVVNARTGERALIADCLFRFAA